MVNYTPIIVAIVLIGGITGAFYKFYSLGSDLICGENEVKSDISDWDDMLCVTYRHLLRRNQMMPISQSNSHSRCVCKHGFVRFAIDA